jgi:hypothetical protein
VSGKTGQSNGVVIYMAGDLERGLATAARLSLADRGQPPDSTDEQLDLPGLLGPPAANTTNGSANEVIPYGNAVLVPVSIK